MGAEKDATGSSSPPPRPSDGERGLLAAHVPIVRSSNRGASIGASLGATLLAVPQVPRDGEGGGGEGGGDADGSGGAGSFAPPRQRAPWQPFQSSSESRSDSTSLNARSLTSRYAAVFAEATRPSPSSTMKPPHPSCPHAGSSLEYVTVVLVSLSSFTKVEASSGPPRLTHTKATSSLYFPLAHLSIWDAQGQHPPHPVKRCSTTGRPAAIS